MINSTDQALSALSITNNVLTQDQKKKLEEDGYILISKTPEEWKDQGINLDQISKVINELIKKEGWRGGWDHDKKKMISGRHMEPGAQRLHELLGKHECFRKVFTIPETLAASKLLIDSDEICFSSLILRMPLPGKGLQPWHIDWIPRKKATDPVRAVLSSLLLDDYTKENGTTRLVPGTHKLLGEPGDYGYMYQDHPNERYIEAPRGSLLIYSTNLWHCGTNNKNGKPRRHLVVHYRDRKIWQQTNFKKELPSNIINELSDAERYLLKARTEDPDRNDWLFNNRNNWFVKKMTNTYWQYLDSRSK